jgi:ferredoxin
MPKIILYRDKCIGCGTCFEMQADIWRMSKKDGKVVLLGSVQKGKTHILNVNAVVAISTAKIAEACPVKIIKIV